MAMSGRKSSMGRYSPIVALLACMLVVTPARLSGEAAGHEQGRTLESGYTETTASNSEKGSEDGYRPLSSGIALCDALPSLIAGLLECLVQVMLPADDSGPPFKCAEASSITRDDGYSEMK
jgi:hypothetical protein